jgi:hypothetical protein
MGSVEAGCCAKGFGVGEQFELPGLSLNPALASKVETTWAIAQVSWAFGRVGRGGGHRCSYW